MAESELIMHLKQGSEVAFTSLYRLYIGKVRHFASLYLTSRYEIEEAVQEAFVKLWETRQFVREEEGLDNFLFIITRNLIFNQYRKSFNENMYKMTVLEGVLDSYTIEEDVIASDLKSFIYKLIDELPQRQREVFLMSREQHLSYCEIAKQLNISEKTVERHINEALKHLKKHLSYTIFLLFI